MQWHRVEKKRAEKILDATRTTGEAGLFSASSSEVKCSNLPFYDNFVLYRLTNFMTMPIFSMDFLSDGEKFYHLDGSADTIMDINKSGNLRLNEDNVVDYLNFYYSSVNDEEGDIYLIENPDDLPFMDSLDRYQQKNIKSHHKDIYVSRDENGKDFIVDTTMFNTGGLMQARIKVSEEGTPSIVKQHLLLSDAIHSYAIKEHGI